MWSESRRNRAGVDLPDAYVPPDEQRRRAEATLASLDASRPRAPRFLGRVLGTREDPAEKAGDQLVELVRRFGPRAWDAGGGRHRRLPGPLADRIKILLGMIISAVPPGRRKYAFARAEDGLKALEGETLPFGNEQPLGVGQLLGMLAELDEAFHAAGW